MEIQAAQVSWLLLSMLFAGTPHTGGNTGQAHFAWVKYSLQDAGPATCGGERSFDATPGKGGN